MTETTDHTEHTDETDHTGHEQQEIRTVDDTMITFNGLMVFRFDPANRICEAGVLHARDHTHSHILQIKIQPDPNTGTGTLTLDPDLLESYVEAGNIRWQLEVAENGQPTTGGIVANPAIPADRRNPQLNNREDFGWVVNVESGEFHSGPLVRTRGKLKPIILLRKGELISQCLSDSVDTKQGPNTRSFGFIAGAIGLRIKPTDGDTAVLFFRDQQGMPTEVFRLPRINEVSYKVSIQNTPRVGPVGRHFHLFYDRLFQGVGGNQKFDLLPHFPAIPPPTLHPPAPDPPITLRCPEGADPHPDPFKCGGLSVGPGGGPLE